jgi:hypothetical protein
MVVIKMKIIIKEQHTVIKQYEYNFNKAQLKKAWDNNPYVRPEGYTFETLYKHLKDICSKGTVSEISPGDDIYMFLNRTQEENLSEHWVSDDDGSYTVTIEGEL